MNPMAEVDDVGARPIVFRAGTADERRRLRRELSGRRWAADCGIPVPPVLDAATDGSWMISALAVARPSTGRGYVDAALTVADRIAAQDPPPTGDGPSGWRARPWSRPVRALQLRRAGISPTGFRSERAHAAALAPTGAVHGDFHDGNVLALEPVAVTIIDWEHLTRGPRFADHVRLIVTIDDPADALHGLHRLLEGSTAEERRSIAVQLRWLSTRHLADHITAPHVPAQRRAEVRDRWRAAHRWARQVDEAGHIT